MPRKITLKGLKKKLWELTKEIVYLRDDNTCQHCGVFVSGQNRHPSHVVPVSRGKVLRYDPQNVKTMCFHCHMNWWHKHPIEAGEWFKSEFPKRWEYLKKRQHDIVNWKRHDYERMIEEHQELLKGLRQE